MPPAGRGTRAPRARPANPSRGPGSARPGRSQAGQVALRPPAGRDPRPGIMPTPCHGVPLCVLDTGSRKAFACGSRQRGKADPPCRAMNSAQRRSHRGSGGGGRPKNLWPPACSKAVRIRSAGAGSAVDLAAHLRRQVLPVGVALLELPGAAWHPIRLQRL